MNGTNYLLPVDADLKSEMDVKLGAAINVDLTLEQTMSDAKVKLVFLDACRDNPFAVLIAVVIRMFLLQTFWIPSPSMATTLVKDDRVVVNKLSYRLHDVRRGDVVVFHRPPSETSADNTINDLIKRVVGLPGENVSISAGVVHIDGRAMDEPYTHGQQTLDGGCSQGDLAKLFTPGGFVVPAGHVLVMGDNRGNSEDGRCFGPIDEDLIVGRAFVVIWPPSHAGGL